MNKDYSEVVSGGDQMRMDALEMMMVKASEARKEYIIQLEQAEKGNYTKKATYLKGIIAGIDMFLEPLD
ncbi:hypothetical protein [Heyndrickxia acidicola]|uniref:Uncharacterized protein n=1 Tax=Heyndrickxia acidicola TaxID=209389 RepID=A0ABU6MF59_9BACI|nr:hypothetical protein [Heyndrickxia acidicola]MED1203064.1 hypothetical protein [Heyndrickxia acidicola]